jgi:GLPGLI family protein
MYCFSQNNTGVATYNVQTDFSFDNSLAVNEQAILEKIFKKSGDVSDTKFKLFFKNEESIFFAEKKLNTNDSKIDLTNIKAKIIGNIYINLKTNEIIQEKEKFGKTFLKSKSINNYSWKLTNEKIKLGKYTCYKAVLNKAPNKKNKTIAWYTADLPINFGPLGYCGLPGLIIMLKDDIFIYTIEEIKFNLSKKEEKQILKPENGLKVTFKQYDSIYGLMMEKKDMMERRLYEGN